MSKNVTITICIVFIVIVGVFFIFSSSSCNRDISYSNKHSLTHLILTTPDGVESDWQELRSVFRKRIDMYGDMRVFQIDHDRNTATVEITGATNPDQMASLLIAPLKIFIKPAEGDAQIATHDEVPEVYSIVFEDESLGLYVSLNDEATTRLKSTTREATPDNSVTINMSIDGRHFSEIRIEAALPEGSLVFPAPESMSPEETDLLSFMLANPLPFDVGAFESSYFMPPKGSKSAPIRFYDVVKEDFLSE